jgi:hypothetical protein
MYNKLLLNDAALHCQLLRSKFEQLNVKDLAELLRKFQLNPVHMRKVEMIAALEKKIAYLQYWNCMYIHCQVFCE